MANQAPDRREFLEMMAVAAIASRFPGFSRWSFASGDATASSQTKPKSYQPLFFTPAEFALLDGLTELIIPADDHPGAQEAGVAEFIDFMAAHDSSIQNRFRIGLHWLDQRALETHNQPFASLASDRQTELLHPLAYRRHFVTGQEVGRQFFLLARQYTVMGYYTTRVGLEQLDYPSLRFYSASPECPHKDDPDHRHLPPPVV